MKKCAGCHGLPIKKPKMQKKTGKSTKITTILGKKDPMSVKSSKL